jgi:hypothetical protein
MDGPPDTLSDTIAGTPEVSGPTAVAYVDMGCRERKWPLRERLTRPSAAARMHPAHVPLPDHLTQAAA